MTELRVGLIILLLMANSVINISAQSRTTRTCRGQYGDTTQCEEDDSCCETDSGRAICCDPLQWWAWFLIFFCSIVFPIVLGCCFFCCMYHARKRNTTQHVIRSQPVGRSEPVRGSEPVLIYTRRTEPSFESETVSFTTVKTSSHNNVEANTNTDAPPSYSDVSQNSEGLPPSYPAA